MYDSKFCNKLTYNSLLDPASNSVIGAQIAIAFLVLFSYPLQCHPCRNSLDKVLPGNNPSATQIPQSRFSMITVGIMIPSYLIAVSVDDLSQVLSVVGAVGSTTICYILPGLFYYKLCENQATPGSPKPLLQKLAVVMVIVGFSIMFTSLSFILAGAAVGH